MNQVIFIGNLGADPVLRTTASGKAVLNFSIAVNNNGSAPDWIPVVCFGDSATHQAKYLQSGTKIAVTGQLRTRTWEDRTGTKHNGFDIFADRIEWLGKVKGSQATSETTES